MNTVTADGLLLEVAYETSQKEDKLIFEVFLFHDHSRGGLLYNPNARIN